MGSLPGITSRMLNRNMSKSWQRQPPLAPAKRTDRKRKYKENIEEGRICGKLNLLELNSCFFFYLQIGIALPMDRTNMQGASPPPSETCETAPVTRG